MSAVNFIFIDFFAAKVDGSDVNAGICKEFSYRQIPGLTSLPSTLTAKKSMKMKFLANKIYYNFFQENPKITNMENSHRRYRHFKENFSSTYYTAMRSVATKRSYNQRNVQESVISGTLIFTLKRDRKNYTLLIRKMLFDMVCIV